VGSDCWTRTSDPAVNSAPTWCAKHVIARGWNVEDGDRAHRNPACFTVRPDDSSRNVTGKGADCTAAPTPSTSTPIDATADVEGALARALDAAAAAGRFDVVAQLARELEARRVASSGAIDLADERAKRRRS
jgi:hypothetical protein